MKTGKIILRITADDDSRDVHAEAASLIGQDPMGALDQDVTITINGCTFRATVDGYAATRHEANLTLTLLS